MKYKAPQKSLSRKDKDIAIAVNPGPDTDIS
jgi:hypothetical protein